MELSDTALVLLNAAAQHQDCLVVRRPKVPPVGDLNACRALVKQGLLATVEPHHLSPELVTVREGDAALAFRLTDAGFRTLNLEPPTMSEADIEEELAAQQEAVDRESGAIGDEAQTAPDAGTQASGPDTAGKDAQPSVEAPVAAPGRLTLRLAAEAVLTAWQAGSELAALEQPMLVLQAFLKERAPRVSSGAPHKPREGTKQEAVLTLLRREEGATIAQVMELTGWASHTVRGFFAGLKKKGIDVQVKERVKVAPTGGKEGAKGSYSIYQVVA